MTINEYLEKLNINEIVEVYNKNKNIIYRGKAGFAPLHLYDEFKNALTTPYGILINAM